MKQKLNPLLRRLIASTRSHEQFENDIVRQVSEYVEKQPPDEALRVLFRLDTRLYRIQTRQAIRYGDGIHPKHRSMKYHDYFTERIKSGERVLDVGCGIGALAYSIAAKSAATVCAIDYDPNHLDQARTRHAHPRITYILGDALVYAPTELFDVIVLSNVLEHLEGRPGLLRRLVKQTGASRLLIRVPRFDRHWSVPLKKDLGVEWRLDVDHKTEYTPESFAVEMQEAGLAITHLEYRWDEIWSELVPQPAI